MTPEDIKEKIMAEMDSAKTNEMVRIEKITGRSMLEILAPHRTSREIMEDIAISQPTVSIWRKKLGIVPDYKLGAHK